MTHFIGLIILSLVINVSAQTIQVPENCIARVTPCLVHTNASSYQFTHDGQKIVLYKDAILKASFDEKRSHFDLIEGRISIKLKRNKKLMLVNDKLLKNDGWYMISRSATDLEILDLDNFNLSVYRSGGTKSSEFSLVRNNFIDKSEFVGFTKYYFESLPEYRKFLLSQSGKWKKEFRKQNGDQTKVLLRTIASEQAKAKIEAEKNRTRSHEEKKAKQTFFYRTFER